ncbi:hypothetical protein EYF80_002253 [Liparis tanakae]|uniref:Uncharacterized protein n=1 Tax=Liparis tanakae TaxID=230148 RepID=A0A4Z2JBG2_9TELE|nr:hypothetical protein EYF80_002253 [Liparis tanakae]
MHKDQSYEDEGAGRLLWRSECWRHNFHNILYLHKGLRAPRQRLGVVEEASPRFGEVGSRRSWSHRRLGLLRHYRLGSRVWGERLSLLPTVTVFFVFICTYSSIRLCQPIGYRNVCKLPGLQFSSSYGSGDRGRGHSS